MKSSVKTTRRAGAAIDEIFTEDCVFYDPMGGEYRGRDEIDRMRARSERRILTSGISQWPSPKKWAMAGGSNGWRAALAKRRLMLVLISSLPLTAGLPLFICFLTS